MKHIVLVRHGAVEHLLGPWRELHIVDMDNLRVTECLDDLEEAIEAVVKCKPADGTAEEEATRQKLLAELRELLRKLKLPGGGGRYRQ